MAINRMLPLGLAIIAATAAFYCNNQAHEIKYDTQALEKKITETRRKIEQYNELNKSLGITSKDYYPSKPILFLKAGGKAENISVYWYKADNNISARASSRDISGKWGKWNGKWIDLAVTPSKKSGYYTIHFANKINSDAFDVLVVVE